MNAAAASELHATAALLEDRAGRLEASADVLAARAAPATWSGPAADRFRALMGERRNAMRAGADVLRQAARAMTAAGGAP